MYQQTITMPYPRVGTADGEWSEPRDTGAGAVVTCPAESQAGSAATAISGDSTDAELLLDLRAGSERAFEDLVSRHHASMVRSAKRYVRDDATAEDVAQETWLGFLESLDRFEGRCSVRTWLFRILINKAKTRGASDDRFVPLSAMARVDTAPVTQSKDASDWAPQAAWKFSPERMLMDQEVHDLVRQVIAALPAPQGDVLDMRDVQGFSANEVCDVLSVSEVHQRVLLHRARCRVRDELMKRWCD